MLCDTTRQVLEVDPEAGKVSLSIKYVLQVQRLDAVWYNRMVFDVCNVYNIIIFESIFESVIKKCQSVISKWSDAWGAGRC